MIIKKIINIYYRYGRAEQRFLRWVIAIPGYLHVIIHSFVATACRVPNKPHKQIAELYFYFFAFSIIKLLPNPLSGWYFLHMAYGAGYYQYRLTLIGVVDNFKVVPLHAWGYLTWRKFWRHRLYPWLVKRYPTWGYLTTLIVWCQHLFVGQSITKFFSVKMLDLTRLTLPFRYAAPRAGRGVQNSTRRPASLHLIAEINNPVDSLIDYEVLSLDSAFVIPRYEPFQEETFGYFEDQQDVTQEEDDEPQQTFDIQYGTNEGGYVHLDDNYYVFRETRRLRPTNNRKKAQPYRQVTNEVLDFNLGSTYQEQPLSKTNLFTLGRLLDPGQAPTALDEEPGIDGLEDDFDPGEQRQQLADWYFFAHQTRHITDIDLLQTEFGGIWRHSYNMWTPGVITQPWKTYSLARGWRRWWWWSRRLHTRRYYKMMEQIGLRLDRPPSLRFLQHQKKMKKRQFRTYKREGTPSRWGRSWWKSRRRANKSRWFGFYTWFNEFEPAVVSKGYSHGVRRLSRQWKRIKKNWLHTDIDKDTSLSNQICPRFLARRQQPLNLELTFFHSGILPNYHWQGRPHAKSHLTDSRRWKENSVKHEAARSVYPRYQPVYSSVSNIDKLLTTVQPGIASNTPSTGVAGIFLVCLITIFLDFFVINWYLELAFPDYDFFYQEHQPENWYQLVQPGLFAWIDIYRLEPPRGLHNWPLNPGGLDGNLYVWSWWVNFWTTSWHYEVALTCPDPQLVSYSTWKWFSDPTPLDWFIASWAPFIPSWAHLIGKIGTTLAYTPGLEEIEMPTRFRELDNQYFRVQGLPWWIISQIYNSEDQYRAAAVHFPIRMDALQFLWHNHLASPTWVNPRDLFVNQQVHLDARYLNFWEVSTQLANQVSDTGFYRGSFYALGRADESQMWPRYMEDSLQGWVRHNIPGKWETSWNIKLIENWRLQSNNFYATSHPLRDEFAWIANLYTRFTSLFPAKLSLPHLQLFLYVARAGAIVVGLTFLFRSAWFTPLTTLAISTMTPTARATSLINQTTDSNKIILKLFAPVRVKQLFKTQVTTQGELPNYDKLEFCLDRPLAWRWSRWEHAFGVTRKWPERNKFSSAGAGRSRRLLSHPNFGFYSLSPRQRSLTLSGTIPSAPLSCVSRTWWSAKTVPWPITNPGIPVTKFQVIPLKKSNFNYNGWLSRPALTTNKSNLILSPTNTSRPRVNDRSWRKAYRLVNQEGLRPRQYHKIEKRYLDDLVRENTRPTTQAANPTTLNLAKPVTSTFALKAQKTVLTSRWSQWLPSVGGSSCLPENEILPSVVYLTSGLAEVNYPGRTKFFHRKATPYHTGTNFGIYEDDHNNEPFVGHQSDEEFDEWEDVDNPFETYNELSTITGTVTSVVTYKTGQTRSNQVSKQLISWSRWCGLPLGWYSQPQTGVTNVYSKGWRVEVCDWSPFSGDHPKVAICPGLGLYDISRLYRRLNRWVTTQVDFPRRAAYCDPWGVTRAARIARTGLGGVGHFRSRGQSPWWKQKRFSWIIQRHFGEDGGDPTGWSTIVDHVWDELQQTGWGPQSVAPQGGPHHDNVDVLGVGSINEIPYLDHSYRAYIVKGWGRHHYSGSAWLPHQQGINLNWAGTPTEVISSLQATEFQPDPEQILFEWWTPPTWVDAYSEEATWIDFYGAERDPEDAFDHPAEGEHNSEVARPRPQDLPAWIIAAAVAGVGSTCVDNAAVGAAARPGVRVWASLWARHTYYASWIRTDGKKPLWWRRRWPVGATRVGSVDWPQEKSELSGGMTPAGVPEVAGHPAKINVAEHIRVWAITEVYLRDRPHGRGTTG